MYYATLVSLVHLRVDLLLLLLLLIIVYTKKSIYYLLFVWVMLTSAFVVFVKETKKLHFKEVWYTSFKL